MKDEIALAVMEGDGIGPEITAATVKVLKAAARKARLGLRLKSCLFGWRPYRKHGTTLPDETLRALARHEGWIVGPTAAGEYQIGRASCRERVGVSVGGWSGERK